MRFSTRVILLILQILMITILCETSSVKHRIEVTSPGDGKVTIYTLTRESADDSTATDISHTAVASANPVVSII